jgi:5'-3' exonuclease
MYSSIALVDAGYLTVRNYKAKASDAKLTPAQVAEYTISNVMAELAATRDAVEHVILCCDAPPYWRAKEYPDYKGTRPEPDPELAVIKRGIFDRIKADGYTIARVDTFEADDLIATLAKEYSKRCPDVRIVGADKDAMQCVTDRVRVFVPKVGKRPEEIMGPAEVRKKFGVMPEAMALYQALVGDTGDNIPGVEKVGAKTAAEWINTYGNSIMKLGIQLAAEADKGDKMAKTWINFGEAYPRMKFWLRMTTLRTDVPIDAEALLVKQKSQPLVPVDDEPDPDLDAIEAQFSADGHPYMDGPSPEELAEEAAVMAANDDNGARLVTQLAKPAEPPRHAFNTCDLHADCAKADGDDGGTTAVHEYNHPGKTDWTVKPKVTDAAALERAIAKANTVPAAKGKKAEPTEAEIDATQASIAEHNAKERARAEFRAKLERDRAADEATAKAQRAATRAPLPDPKAGEVMASAAKEFNESRQVAPKVTDAEFTEQPKPKPAKVSQEERFLNGEAPTTALARVPQDEQEFRMSLQPRTFGEAVVASKYLFNSRRYGQHGSDAGIVAMICTGRELGLTMMQTLNGFHVVKDKPFCGWQLLKSLAERHPDCEWLMCSHSDEESATWRTKHRIHGILEYTYTYDRAVKAGVVAQNRQNWEGKPTEMVCKTSLSKAVWLWYTSALIGLPLDDTDAPAEEMGDAASV